MTKYIELNSTFRNRSQWPSPSEFETSIAVSAKSKTSALDPISDMAPIVTWSGSFDNAASSASVAITGILATGVGFSNTPNKFAITATAGRLRTEENFYKGAVIFLDDGAGTTIRTRIASYTFVDGNVSDKAIVEVVDPVPELILAGSTGFITNPTDATLLKPVVFVPFDTRSQNRFVGHCIINLTRPADPSRVIVSYDPVGHLAHLASAAATWVVTDEYVIRKSCADVETSIAQTLTTVQLAATASSVDDFYNGDFIQLLSPLTTAPFSTTTAPFGEVRKIVDYDGATQTATVSSAFTAVAGAPPTYSILTYSRDNYSSVSYNGSRVSQQQAVCHKCSLLELILPNKVLDVGDGGLLAFYPYVYVELRNELVGNRDTLYTNNPNATKALFRCAIDDVNNPVISSFLFLDSESEPQTIKFTMNGSLKFRVFLPTGETLNFVDDDTSSPNAPDPSLQISALFAIERV